MGKGERTIHILKQRRQCRQLIVLLVERVIVWGVEDIYRRKGFRFRLGELIAVGRVRRHGALIGDRMMLHNLTVCGLLFLIPVYCRPWPSITDHRRLFQTVYLHLNLPLKNKQTNND